MGRCRVVKPDVVRLPLSDGDFLDVKKRLNTGEYRELMAGMTSPSPLGGSPVIDFTRVGLTKVLQYLVGWSFVGFDDKPLLYSLDLPESVRLATLRSLDPDDFEEVETAIDAHEAREEQAAAERKNVQAGESASSATSTSAA